MVLIHEGGETGAPNPPLDWNNSRCPNARGRIFEIAQQLSPAVDVVFSAHSHQGYNCLQDGRPNLQATSFGRGVAVVDVALNPRSGDADHARPDAAVARVVGRITGSFERGGPARRHPRRRPAR